MGPCHEKPPADGYHRLIPPARKTEPEKGAHDPRVANPRDHDQRYLFSVHRLVFVAPPTDESVFQKKKCFAVRQGVQKVSTSRPNRASSVRTDTNRNKRESACGTRHFCENHCRS